MKPDPHKYKDKQKYKAKTGHQQQSKQKHESPESAAKNSQSARTDKSAKEQDDSQISATQNDAHCKSSTEHTEDSAEQLSPDQPVKSFQRRKLVSNWSRYELPDEALEGGPHQRGADFTQLLQNAGSSVSQLRLSDEQSWDKDIQVSSDADHLSTFLSLDCDDLVSALECIPVYQCYGLEEIKDEIFTKDQIETMKKYAELCDQHYNPKMKRHDNASLVNAVSVTPSKENIVLSSKVIYENDRSLSSQHSVDVVQTDSDINTSIHQHATSSNNVTDILMNIDNIVGTSSISSSMGVTHDTIVSNHCDVNGDNDRLKLSDIVTSQLCSVPPIASARSVSAATQEDDLDLLLNMDNPVKASPPVENLPASASNKQAQIMVSDLEDMLDGLLDD